MYDYSIAEIDHFKEAFVSRYTPEQIILYADELLGGKLTVGYDSFETLRYNPHKVDLFDWGMTTTDNSNTFSLYLLGLRHVYLLAKAYEYNPKSHYLELAEDFVCSFYQYFTRHKELYGMTNNDHAIAERIENLVYLYYVAKKAHYLLDSEGYLVELIEDSVEKLLGDTYYQKNHNHGIIVDKAALIGLSFLNDPTRQEDIEYVVNRLKTQVEYAFANDGVHKENSMDYHFSVVNLLLGCYYVLEHIGHEYHKALYDRLIKSAEYVVYALKPDNYRPLFGDSKGIPTPQNEQNGTIKKPLAKDDIFIDDRRLQYVYHQGKDGVKPKQLSVFFPSGYVFFREHFKRGRDYKNATWLSFKAGYTTRVHKHRDDLSICLYSKGFDIFVDSGMCGYMPKDKFKDYMESIPAHSTVGIRGKDYSIAGGNGEQFKIQQFARGAHYDYAMASARVYQDTSIYRHVYYIRNRDIIIIRDEIHSTEEQTYVQYFNLSNYVSLLPTSGKNRVELKIGDSRYSAVVRQLQPVDDLNVLEGGKTRPFSYLSTGFGSCEESKTLEYSMRGDTVQFITVVEIRRNNAKNCEINLLPDAIVIEPDETIVPIEEVVPVSFNGAKVTCKKNILTIDILRQQEDRIFAFYVYTKDEILKYPYSAERTLTYTHKGNQDFTVLLYVANQNGEKVKGILGDFRSTETGIEAKKIYDALHTCRVLRRGVEEIGSGRYRFSIDLNYDYEPSFQWWVYYNGSCLHAEQNKSRIFEFECVKPGEYVIMYSIRDRFFGEIDFYQFDKLIVEEC